MNYCRYVNIFHGCGEITPEIPEGIAAKWFFIKAQSGNTNPAATLPFGGISAGPYSGGYPTGYNDHQVNTHAAVKHFESGRKLKGFTHFHQSGTGYIGYFYNYALTIPCYDESPERRAPGNETGSPGYYSCSLEDIHCELTADNKTAFHRYTFGKPGGLVKIDFTNNGLDFDDEKLNAEHRGTVESVTVGSSDIITAEIQAEGIKLYFAVSCNGSHITEDGTVTFYGFGKEADLKVAVSLRSIEKAKEYLSESTDFDTARMQADRAWNRVLSKFRIKTDDEKIKRIFYSNLYHSLVKPCDRSGENFVDGSDGGFVYDFATLWDMYKTQLPLVFMAYGGISVKIVNTLLSLCDVLGEIPNSLGLSSKYNEHSTQARVLGCYALMTAYRYGIKTDPHRMVKAIEKDIFADNKKDFTEDGRCRSHTWTLDMADCCGLCAEIAENIGETETAARLKAHSGKWENCFDGSTGLLSADSLYYEGSLYNYSFRQMSDMDRRIEIAGGREKFVKLLDEFFGYGCPDVKQPTDPDDTGYIEKTMSRGIFEGFNNEPDTEAPFSYIYAGRQDRTCEIVRAGMKYMFTEGRGGIPGNNDSGALSSYYCFMAVGIFPVAGQDLFLIGSPFVDSAEISLSSGEILKIKVRNNSPENIYVKSVKFEGKPLNNFMISAKKLMCGGTLEFEMTGENENA